MTDVLSLPRLPSHHAAERVLRGKITDTGAKAQTTDYFWPASFWKLDQSRQFQQLSEQDRSAVLALLSAQTIEESYFIEKGAMDMMARFITEAKSADEKALYALFAAEEARHYRGLSPYYAGLDRDRTRNPFLDMLSEVMTSAEHDVAVYILQVILEGWGRWHYKRLLSSVQNADLKALFETIISDEAGHHGAGLIFSHERLNGPSSENCKASILAYLRRILDMIRVGPLRLAATLNSFTALCDEKTVGTLLDEIEAAALVNEQLDMIRTLIKLGPHAHEFLADCRERLEPVTNTELARSLSHVFVTAFQPH